MQTLSARQAQQAPCPYKSGAGAWRYQLVPDLLRLPDSEVDNDENGHGVSKDSQGNIYFTFVPKKVDADTQVLVKFRPDGTGATMLGAPGPEGLSGGTPHGLRIEHDPVANASFFYHANNEARVMKTTLDGEMLWTADFSHWETERPEYWPYTPTDAVVVPGTDLLLVADGYGSSFVHVLNKSTGEFLESRTFGGKGNTTDPLRFDTPHGINVDPSRPGTFVVSDRSNNRLVWFTAEGEFVHTAPSVPLPCNADIHEDEHAGNVTVVPSLGLNYDTIINGSVAIYDQDTTLLSVIEVAGTIGHLGHQHPHDALFLPNGDVVVCCWGGPANPGQGDAKGTVSYWKRIVDEHSALVV